MEGDGKFIADVHLGRLVRGLRMLGFDVLYQNIFSNIELKTLAAEQNRTLLTRNTLFLKDPAIKTFVVESEDWLVQLQTVVRQFQLKDNLKPFSRCLICNGILKGVSKEEAEPRLEEKTRKYYNEFWRCENCKRLYWKGSHYERMEKRISQLKRPGAET